MNQYSANGNLLNTVSTIQKQGYSQSSVYQKRVVFAIMPLSMLTFVQWFTWMRATVHSACSVNMRLKHHRDITGSLMPDTGSKF